MCYVISCCLDTINMINYINAYNLQIFSAWEVLNIHKPVLTSIGIQKSDDELGLPYIFFGFQRLSTPVQNVLPSRYPFYSQTCLHIISNVIRSNA